MEASVRDFRPSFVTMAARSTCDDDQLFFRMMPSHDARYSVDLRGFGDVG